MAKKKIEYLMELPVSYGNLSIGDKTARLGIVVGRPALSLTAADKNLCDRRVVGRILVRAGDGGPEQGSIPGLEGNDDEVKAVFDVKGFSVSKKAISFGLTMQIESIAIETLSHFAKRKGMLYVEEIGDIPEGEAEGDDDE